MSGYGLSSSPHEYSWNDVTPPGRTGAGFAKQQPAPQLHRARLLSGDRRYREVLRVHVHLTHGHHAGLSSTSLVDLT